MTYFKLNAAIISGVSLLAMGSPTYAQTANDTETQADTDDNNVIVVTATKRAADLQSTSASISAFDAESLETRSLGNVEDIGLVDASAQVAIYQGEAQVFLRGVGTPITIGGTDSATAIYRDGEFLSRSAASVPGFFDVAQVEILKGPQGTLYGRNATAGSVLITSKAPTEEFSGEAEFTYGNYNRVEVFGAISGPIVEDKLLFRVAGKYARRDGYTDLTDASDPNNIRTFDVEDKDEIFVRSTLEFRATDDLTLSLTGDYYRADDRANTFFLIDNSFGFAQPPFNPVGPALNTFGIPAGNFGINNFTLLGQISGNISEERTRDNQFANADYFNKPEIWGLSGRLNWDIDGYTLSTVTAYRETRPLNQNDFDLSDSIVGTQTQLRREDQWQFAQEIQVASPDNGPFQWIAGASLFIERNKLRNEFLISSLPTLFDFAVDNGIFPETIGGQAVRLPAENCCVFKLNGDLETEAYSAFVDGSYDVTDRLTVRAGIRYSSEERSGQNLLSTELELNNPVLLGAPFTNIAPFPATTFDAFTPKFGLDFQASDDLFLYASVTRGFKSGGFNIGSLQNEPFDQELTWSYEAGLRSEFLDGAVRLNATGFYYDVSDLQVQTVVNNSIVVNNAAGAEVYGLEINAVIEPVDGFIVDFSGTYLNAEITEIDIEAAIDPTRLSFPSDGTLANVIDDPTVIPATGAFNIVGNKLPKAPEFQFNLGFQYEIDLQSGGELLFRSDLSYQDDIFFNQFNDTGFDGLPVEPLRQDGYYWAKLRIAYTDPSGKYTIAGFVDNLFDEEVVTNAVYNGAVSGQFGLGSLAPPRTYGVTAKVSF